MGHDMTVDVCCFPSSLWGGVEGLYSDEEFDNYVLFTSFYVYVLLANKMMMMMMMICGYP